MIERVLPLKISGLIVLLMTSTYLRAQPGSDQETTSHSSRRQYIEFPIDANFEALLKMRLQSEKDLGPWKEIFKKITDDPKQLQLDPQKIKELKLDNPDLKKALQEWTQRDPALKTALRDWIKQNSLEHNPQSIQQWQKNLESILNQPPPASKHAPKEPNVATRLEPKRAPLKSPEEDPLARAAEKAMKQVEDTKIGGWLRNSPAWQRAFDDLRASLLLPVAPRSQWNEWGNRLRISDPEFWKRGEQALEKIRTLPQPNLERWSRNLSMPSLGNVTTPIMPNPGYPDVAIPSASNLGVGMSWLLLMLILCLGGWVLIHWSWRSRSDTDDLMTLGPWPVRPEMVSTRTQLVHAFDYLALLTLGRKVQSWNHQAIAQRWSEQIPTCSSVARELAHLYEQARYTEGTEILSDSHRDRARQSLQKLAEAF